MRPTLAQKKTNLRQRLLGTLQSNSSSSSSSSSTGVDNPLLTYILLANVSENDLPMHISKNGLTETETISDADTAMTRESEIRSALLSSYKSIVGFAARLNAMTTETQLAALEAEINEVL